MSRAFVKEDDSAPPPPPLERPVSGAPNLVTPRGARLIDESVERLEREIAQASAEAAEPLKRDLRYWLARRASAQVVESEADPASAGFGSAVTIRRDGRDLRITIVGEDEADPDRGLVAWTSPLARAVDEAEPGDVVEFEAGGRVSRIEVLGVESGAG